MAWNNVRGKGADGGKDEAGTVCGGSLTLGSVLVEGKKEVDGEMQGGCGQETGAAPDCVIKSVTFIYIALLTIQILSKQPHNIKIGSLM